jgi:pimeloyl-ACP methyl ester carboxylesterase
MYIPFGLISGVLVVLALLLVMRTMRVIRKYTPHIIRVFEERPVFVVARRTPLPEVPEIRFPTRDGQQLSGSYLFTPHAPAQGLIVFSHEFAADRWSGMPYCTPLVEAGFDVFAFDFRHHGSSSADAGYRPRHWVTWREVADLEAAVEFVRSHRQVGHLPIGLYGISRGGGSALCVAARNRQIRCVVTDGAFPTHLTMTVYMRKWVKLYGGQRAFFDWLPDWYYGFVRDRALARVARQIGVGFPRIERLIARIAPRPLLMIHGGRDNYIRPEIARALCNCAGAPKELWIVPGARHNACLDVAGPEYAHRTVQFFVRHLAATPAATTVGPDGTDRHAA